MNLKLMREGLQKFIDSLEIPISGRDKVKIIDNLLKLWSETLFTGYKLNPYEALNTKIPSTSHDPVYIANIPFTSICQDHFLPFSGHVSIGYIPDKEVAGLSSLVRVVQVLSAKLQLQENLTSEIAEVIYKSLDPLAIGIYMKAQHFCLKVRLPSGGTAELITTAFKGDVEEYNFKNEFLRIIRDG